MAERGEFTWSFSNQPEHSTIKIHRDMSVWRWKSEKFKFKNFFIYGERGNDSASFENKFILLGWILSKSYNKLKRKMLFEWSKNQDFYENDQKLFPDIFVSKIAIAQVYAMEKDVSSQFKKNKRWFCLALLS